MSTQSPPLLSTLSLTCAYSYAHYRQISDQFRQLGEYQRRSQIEEGLLTEADEFSVPGYCYITGRYTEFSVKWDRARQKKPRWRETLFSDALYYNRVRASMHLFEYLLRPRQLDPIYITEQCSPLYAWLKEKYPNTIGSEYLGATATPGSIDERGLRHESLTRLSFSDQSLQFVLSFDCFEHFADYKKGLRECARVLRPGGSLLITVPFRSDSEDNIVRAAERQDGTLDYLLPPEYHSDPLNMEGCLCYYHFGWQLLDDMRDSGFRDPRACLYWSREYGYLGMEQVLLCADK